jgi:hypothetical protein
MKKANQESSTQRIREAAQLLHERLMQEYYYPQEQAVEDLRQAGLDEFIYANENGNPAINGRVLKLFKQLRSPQAEWDKGDKAWTTPYQRAGPPLPKDQTQRAALLRAEIDRCRAELAEIYPEHQAQKLKQMVGMYHETPTDKKRERARAALHREIAADRAALSEIFRQIHGDLAWVREQDDAHMNALFDEPFD